jgi:CRP/FNR family transcriptional regulator
MDRTTALRKTDLFGSLSPTELAALARACRERALAKGEALFAAGEEVPGLYVVLKGTFRAVRGNAEGREQVIHVEKAGATLGEVPVFDDKPAPSTVVAEEAGTVLFIAKDDVRRLCRAHPEIALGALKVLASRLRRTAATIESLALQGIDQRLAAYLYREFTEGRTRRMRLPANTVIAARLGSVREVVSRAFSRLEAEGWVAWEKGRVLVLKDAKGLGTRAGK